MSNDKALTANDPALGREIGLRFSRMVADSVDVVSVADQAYKLKVGTDGKLEGPPGATPEQLTIMQHALLPNKEVPTYLARHYGRVELAHKIAGDRSNAPPELARLVISVVQAPRREYDVIDVTPEEE